LKVPKSSLVLVRGLKNRRKQLQVNDMDEATIRKNLDIF